MHKDEAGSSRTLLNLCWGHPDSEGKLHREVLLREMDGDDEDVLADRSSSFLSRLNVIFGNCIEKIGTITDKAQVAALMPSLVGVDRILLMLRLREISLNPIYQMKAKCEHCGRIQRLQIDLSKLEVTYPEKPQDRLRTFKAPSGKTVLWQVMTGVEEEISHAIRENEDEADKSANDLERARLSYALWLRVHKIDKHQFNRGKGLAIQTDIDDVPIVDMEEIAILKKLPMRDRMALRRHIEATEGGPKMEFDFRCTNPGCKKLNVDVDIDIVQAEFFFPSEMSAS
jgi:hypothetical protein